MLNEDFSLYELIYDYKETKNKDKLKNHKRKRLFKKIWYWTKFTFLVLAFVYVFCGITFLVFSTFNCL